MKPSRALTATILAAALLSLIAACFLSVFTDREGGVTVILWRRAPAWPADTYGMSPSEVGFTLVRGNENGVAGSELTRWNARFGVWLFTALAAGRLWQHQRARLNSTRS